MSEKLLWKIKGEDIDSSTELDITKAVYGNKKGLEYKHYVYKGFESNTQFLNHIKTLLEWRTIKRDSVHPILLSKDEDSHIIEDYKLLEKLGTLTLETKDLNQDLALGIQQAREQYIKMKDALSKFQFLKNNLALIRDMKVLEDKLVQGGFLTPEEVFDVTPDELFES